MYRYTLAILMATPWAGFAAAQDVPKTDSSEKSLREVTVISNNPVGATSIELKKFPGNVQTLNNDNPSPGSASLAERLNQSLGSVTVNDTQGNPFQVDINYRGFTASPILGTPQGLSVYLDGMRVNEPFGDIVSWDLLPQIAVNKITVIPGSNPVYGLNTLGGAVSLTTKNGNTFTGTQARVGVGSFGRNSVDVERGSHTDKDSVYLAASHYSDKGWAAHNPSKIRQLFGKYMAYDNAWNVGLSMAYADNLLYGNQTVPLSMLDQAQLGYSHPDYVGARNLALNLQGTLEPDTSNTYDANLYFRRISRDVLNSNLGSLVSSSTNDPSCIGNSPIDCPAANLLARYSQNIIGSNLLWANSDPLWKLPQQMTVGLNAEWSKTRFANSGQYAVVDASNGLNSVGATLQQADLASTNQRLGLFATSTLDATDKLAVTLSARFDYASIRLSGQSCIDDKLCDSTASISSGQLADVGGYHTYKRLNPSLGLAYQMSPDTVVFANYAQGFRTPSAIELACADPAAPCSGIPNAFGADPDLRAVVSKTIEMGFRGNLDRRTLWKVAYFHSKLQNDILFNQSSLTTGYFSNLGHTLRQGLELSIDGRLEKLSYAIDADWTDARYQTVFQTANTSNSANAVLVQPGNKIPGVAPWQLKARLNYQLAATTKLGMAALWQGPQYARGDENNADRNGRVPGFSTLKLDVSHGINKTWSLNAGVNNALNARYSTHATLAVNNLGSGAAEQFRSVTAPRSYFVGLQAWF